MHSFVLRNFLCGCIKMSLVYFLLISTAISQQSSFSECPNACSGHGDCRGKSVCSCYRQWMGNDCSERICQFGIAHIDTPKGDLDGSKSVSGISDKVVAGHQIYPKGTVESYCELAFVSSEQQANTAHQYAECSNRGLCDRTQGLCACYDGYSGSACQRADCPVINGNKCSGHGTCLTIEELAELDNGNVYKLWDHQSTMGCNCDPGYTGAACNRKKCEIGYDPLYFNSGASHRYSNWSIVIYTKSATATISGNYTITLFDVYDEDWTTEHIQYNTSCSSLVRAIEKLPNNAFPINSVRCLKWENYNGISSEDESILPTPNKRSGIKYTLAFPSNAGELKPPILNFNTGDQRSSIQSNENGVDVGYFVYANGFQGETKDYVQDRCMNVDVTLSSAGTYDYLTGLTPFETRLLKRCLGEADGNTDIWSDDGTAQGSSFKWDYGNRFNPHLIKLVDLTEPGQASDLCGDGSDNVRDRGDTGTTKRLCVDPRPPGFFVLLKYDEASQRFQLFNRPSSDYSSKTNFAVFTTTGTVQMVSDRAKVWNDPADMYSLIVRTTNSSLAYPGYWGNIDCESNPAGMNGAFDCLQVGSLAFFLDPSLNSFAYSTNPKYINLYKVKKVSIERQLDYSTGISRTIPSPEIRLSSAVTSQWGKTNLDNARAYIFYPPEGYEYVLPCSGRGYCFEVFGDCECFNGYSGVACEVQDGKADYEG